MPRKVIDWVAIEREWNLGQLDIAQIARDHGISGPAIHNRANRKGWAPRPEKSAVVTDLVTSVTRDPETITTPRVALTAFHRVIMLLMRHRGFLARLHGEFEACLADVTAKRSKWTEQGYTPRLDEIETITNIAGKAALSMAKLIPLERRAFGLTDTDGPSEFDALTPEQLEAVENTVRKALGMRPAEHQASVITIEAEDQEDEAE